MKLDYRTEKRKLGDIGENMACEFLKRRGFKVLERNYLKMWGEIDIVAQKGEKLYFVEVKSISCRFDEVGPHQINVSNETIGHDLSHGTGGIRPEENMHPGKIQRLLRTIQTYLLHKKLVCDWQLDLITVKIDLKTKQARVEILENIVI